MGILNELMNRHELYGGNAQASEIFDSLRMAQPGIGSAQLSGYVGMVDRKPFDMHFVNNRLMPLGTRMAVIAPVEIRRSHDAFRHEGSAVDVVRWTVRIVERIREYGLIPSCLSFNRPRIRVQEQLGRIAAVPFLGLPGSVHTKAITLARPNVGQVTMPTKTCNFR